MNNIGLVQHCENALKLPTKYMWGGIFRLIEKQYDMLYSMYGNKPGTGYTPQRWDELSRLKNTGTYGVDCIGLVKSYYWGGVGSPKYDGKTDVNAGTMYNLAKVKGKISTIPETPGLVVYSKTHPHVGVYIGGGYTVESTLGSRGDGVVKHKLDSFWEYWFQCPFIDYGSSENADIDTVAREVIAGKWGAGEERKKRLTAAGYDYNAVQKRVNAILQGTA